MDGVAQPPAVALQQRVVESPLLAEFGHELPVLLKFDRDEGVDGIAGQQVRRHEREETHGKQDSHQSD